MQAINRYKKFLTTVTFYDYAYDTRPLSLFSSDLSHTRLLFRFLKLIIAFPLSLLTWAILRTISVRYKISIYVLKTFRPGFASTYINMMEPLCRQLQHENNLRHIKIIIEPGAAVSDVLVKSYEPHFTLYLDDRRKFARLVAYLIPKSGLEKRFINTSNNFLPSWRYPPSKNHVNQGNQVPSDLTKIGIGKENYVLFVHGSRNYYQKVFTSTQVSEINYRFLDLTTYSQAIDIIIENNLRVVRVGMDVDELPDALKLSITDYTGKLRNEVSELWLYENCKFLLSVCNGAFWFARRFDRPSIITDSYNLLAGNWSTLYTPMTIRNKESGVLLSFTEMLKLRTTPNFLTNQFMKDYNLELMPNSSLTIANAVEEMLNPFNDKNVPTRKDTQLMGRYKALLTEFNIPVAEKMSLPAISFLREYKNLL